MNWADIAILTIIGISALISLFRGFVREVLSLVAWVAAFWVAFTFTESAATILQNQVANSTFRYVLTFIGLLVVSLLIFGIINFLIGKLIDSTGLTGTDRVLGVVFGVVRGAAIIVILVFLAILLLPEERDEWWQESVFMKHFESMAKYAVNHLPPEILDKFKAPSGAES